MLFAGSIAENIRYGVPSATDGEVAEAARQVRTMLAANGRGVWDGSESLDISRDVVQEMRAHWCRADRD